MPIKCSCPCMADEEEHREREMDALLEASTGGEETGEPRDEVS